MRKHSFSCAVRTSRVYTMIRVFLALSIAVCVLAQGDGAVDPTNPGGSPLVNKNPSPAALSPSALPAAVDPSSSGDKPAPLVPGSHLTRAERKKLRKEMRVKTASNVDVTYPLGSVVVRRGGENRPRNVNVVYPGGSVNVGDTADLPEGAKPAVNVEYPGGSVRLQPKMPGERRKGVIEFPFGRVVLS